MKKEKIYISGPMSNKPNLNRELFYEAAKRWNDLPGVEAVNPFDVVSQSSSYWDCMRADLAELLTCDAIAMLPDWENSKGACLEKQVAESCGLRVYDASRPRYDPQTLAKESVAQEAERLVAGARQGDYGHPKHDFKRTAALWSGLLGLDIAAKMVPLMMICLKLSRQAHADKRDNLVDIAGYALTAEMLGDENVR